MHLCLESLFTKKASFPITGPDCSGNPLFVVLTTAGQTWSRHALLGAGATGYRGPKPPNHTLLVTQTARTGVRASRQTIQSRSSRHFQP
ncbi:unnamed protein product [Protopolystoma xenopodis]|uniref:Uncharacterized protein n=1 Tax=Protopolystoma xenopodis TaxID=117903 RepID=A0A3S5BH20_9PLAT|nr:unnamed protein product [Protopolystoma xenopodis]